MKSLLSGVALMIVGLVVVPSVKGYASVCNTVVGQMVQARSTPTAVKCTAATVAVDMHWWIVAWGVGSVLVGLAMLGAAVLSRS